jgi:hypothetical protein
MAERRVRPAIGPRGSCDSTRHCIGALGRNAGGRAACRTRPRGRRRDPAHRGPGTRHRGAGARRLPTRRAGRRGGRQPGAGHSLRRHSSCEGAPASRADPLDPRAWAGAGCGRCRWSCPRRLPIPGIGLDADANLLTAGRRLSPARRRVRLSSASIAAGMRGRRWLEASAIRSHLFNELHALSWPWASRTVCGRGARLRAALRPGASPRPRRPDATRALAFRVAIITRPTDDPLRGVGYAEGACTRPSA